MIAVLSYQAISRNEIVTRGICRHIHYTACRISPQEYLQPASCNQSVIPTSDRDDGTLRCIVITIYYIWDFADMTPNKACPFSYWTWAFLNCFEYLPRGITARLQWDRDKAQEYTQSWRFRDWGRVSFAPVWPDATIPWVSRWYSDRCFFYEWGMIARMNSDPCNLDMVWTADWYPHRI